VDGGAYLPGCAGIPQPPPPFLSPPFLSPPPLPTHPGLMASNLRVVKFLFSLLLSLFSICLTKADVDAPSVGLVEELASELLEESSTVPVRGHAD